MAEIYNGGLGADVSKEVAVQERLKVLGFYPSGITGVFDAATVDAVKEFQHENSLPITGDIDDITMSELYAQTDVAVGEIPQNPLSSAKPTLRRGDTGPAVSDLQTRLMQLGYLSGAVDGIFGTATEDAVKRFQADNNLVVDGIVGPATWNVLDYLYSPIGCVNPPEPPEPPEPPGPPVEYCTYTVVAGDSLWIIANRFGTTVDELKRINGLTSDLLSIGQTILYPCNGGGTEPPEPPEPPVEYCTYTVVAGDSLWTIARRFGTTVDELKRINKLTTDLLSIGQVLKYPCNGGGDYWTYTVVAGDSLWTIARRFGTTVDAIMALNGLSSDRLSIGQQLKIPGEEAPTTPDYWEYTVVSGDSLWSISRRFGTTADALRSLNGLTSDTLRIGQILRIPGSR